jgi:phenylalanyl-tRNA synthetase alpha subunit
MKLIIVFSSPNIDVILNNNPQRMNLTETDKKWLSVVEAKSKDLTLSETERAYFSRILRVCAMPNLTKALGNPINLLIERVIHSPFYKEFDHVDVPEIVAEFETFDLFNFPENHVARRPSDSYFIQKSADTRESVLLRPHTSVMWYHYLVKGGGIEKLQRD